MDPFSPPSGRDAFSPPSTDAFSPAPSVTSDAFSPPLVMDAFSPPPPDPSSPPVRRRPRSRTRKAGDNDNYSRSSLGREVLDSELYSSSRRTKRPNGTTNNVGREVLDSELYSSRNQPSPFLPSRPAVGREVRDNELFSASRLRRRTTAPTSPTSLGREVRDTELFRRRTPRPSSLSSSMAPIGREVRDDELYSRARRARSDLGQRVPRTLSASMRMSRQQMGSSPLRDDTEYSRRRNSLPNAKAGPSTRRPPPRSSLPKRPRPRAEITTLDYKKAREKLEATTGEKLTLLDSNLYSERFDPLPWRIGRDKGGLPKSSLAELCLERLRKTVKYGLIDKEKDLSLLPDDFAYELFTDEKLPPERLQVIENSHPELAHSVEAAFAEKLSKRIGKTTLPQGMNSWRECFENEQEVQRERLNNARWNLKCNYNESKSDAAVKRVGTVARDGRASMASKRRRSGNTEQLSKINRLKDIHRRDRKRRR